MPSPDGIILGFDPGGAGNFGWSVCVTGNGRLVKRLAACVANDALSALRAVEECLKTNLTNPDTRVLAAGVDAPMFWSRTGSRAVDGLLRDRVRAAGITSSVMQINSLQGSVLVQGVLLGKLLLDTWNLKITESHPKVLNHLLGNSKQCEVIEMMVHVTEGLKEDSGGHMRDATLAAISAWAMFHESDGWEDLYLREPQPVNPFGYDIAYWMPKPTTTAR